MGPGNSLLASLPGSVKHHKIEPQLARILENTIREYFPEEEADAEEDV